MIYRIYKKLFLAHFIIFEKIQFLSSSFSWLLLSYIFVVFGVSAYMWNNLLYKLQIHGKYGKKNSIWILQKYNNDYNLSKLSIHFKKALVFDISLIFFNPKYHFVRFIIYLCIVLYRYLILWKISSNEKFDMSLYICAVLF